MLFFIFSIVIILFSITIHEYSHGKVAELFGDPTPRASGRLTLNPMSHIDPIGLLMLVIVRFGWAKPIPVDPGYFKDPEKDMAIVGLAGPASNFLLAFIISLLFKYEPFINVASSGDFGVLLVSLLQFALFINIALGVFNLLPIPPLDGSRLLRAVLPYEGVRFLDSIEPYGFFILIFVLVMPGISDVFTETVRFISGLLL